MVYFKRMEVRNMKKITWIGTGVMGKPMAYHLADAGYEVTVYNRTYEKALTMQDKTTVAKTIPEAVKDADVVFTIVGYPQDVEEIYLGDNGILNNVKENAIVVDMTTSSPELAIKIYEEALKKNIQSLDSPVTGGDLGAINATLSIMVGGNEEIFNKVLPLLEVLGKQVTYMGKAGNGQFAKLANQICIAGAIASTAEALSFAKANGLDETSFLEVVNNGSAASWQSTNMGPKMINEDYDPGFFIKHLIKDLRLSQAVGEEGSLPISKQVLSQYEQLLEQGYGDLGTQAISKYYKSK